MLVSCNVQAVGLSPQGARLHVTGIVTVSSTGWLTCTRIWLRRPLTLQAGAVRRDPQARWPHHADMTQFAEKNLSARRYGGPYRD
jgi:hypothetical protein